MQERYRSTLKGFCSFISAIISRSPEGKQTTTAKSYKSAKPSLASGSEASRGSVTSNPAIGGIDTESDQPTPVSLSVASGRNGLDSSREKSPTVPVPLNIPAEVMFRIRRADDAAFHLLNSRPTSSPDEIMYILTAIEAGETCAKRFARDFDWHIDKERCARIMQSIDGRLDSTAIALPNPRCGS